MDKKFVITIARQYGSGGKTIGEMLSKELGVEYYNKDLILKASEESGINVSLFANADEKSKGLFNKLKKKNYGGEVLDPSDSNFTSEENLFNYQAKIIRELAENTFGMVHHMMNRAFITISWKTKTAVTALLP